MLTSLLIYAGIVPLVAAACAALVCRAIGASNRGAWAASVTAGVLAGQVGWKSQAGIGLALRAFARPAEAADWLPIIFLLALGLTLLFFVATPRYRRLLIVLAAAFCVSVPLRLVSGNVQFQEWSAAGKIIQLALLAAAYGLVWVVLVKKGEEQTFGGRVVATAIVAVVAAVVLTQSGVLVYGLACGSVAAAIGGAALVDVLLADNTLERKRFAFRGYTGAAGPITFSLGSLIVLGLFFANLTTLNAMLLLAAMVAAGGPLPGAFVTRPLWFQLAIRALFCSIPLVVAVVSVLD
jgi:hypothetical protein